MCSLSGNANSWRRATDGSVSIPNSSYTMWLERNDLLEENFVSSVLLDTTACDDPSAIPGATVVLHSGAPYADRTTIASR